MLKKVLCVVLALVLALGTMSVVSFAATADDLAAAVAKLPDDYNAQFYNDKTVAAITAAKSAAASATSASEIDAAIALCNEAYALVMELGIDEYYGGEYYVNRDESKAVVHYNLTPDKTTVKQGDTFQVTVSLKANFYMGSGQLALAYDSDAFEVVEVTYPGDISTIVKFSQANTDFISGNGSGRYGYVPVEWYETTEGGKTVLQKYKVIMQAIRNNLDYADSSTITWAPFEEVDTYVVTFRVKDTAADGTAKVFVDDTLRNGFFEWETDEDFYEAVFAVNRGCGENLLYTGYKRMNGSKLVNGASPVDEQASYDQTFYYGGGEGATPYTSTDIYGGSPIAVNGVSVDMTIGVEPADYAELDKAIEDAAEYEAVAEEYTVESYKALTDAVAAAKKCSRELTADDQATIDELAKAVNDAIAALQLKPVAEAPVVSVTTTAPARYMDLANLDVVVKGNPIKIRFVDSAGNSITLTRDHDNVLAITDNGDETETWNVNLRAYKLEENYTVFARYAEDGWNEVPYAFTLVSEEFIDDRFISWDIADDVDGVIYEGVHTVTVQTGLDVIKVQFMKGSNTWTYNADNATYVDEGGVRTWTINFNFSTLGNNSFIIRTRTGKTTFAATGETMDALVYSK